MQWSMMRPATCGHLLLTMMTSSHSHLPVRTLHPTQDEHHARTDCATSMLEEVSYN